MFSSFFNELLYFCKNVPYLIHVNIDYRLTVHKAMYFLNSEMYIYNFFSDMHVLPFYYIYFPYLHTFYLSTFYQQCAILLIYYFI